MAILPSSSARGARPPKQMTIADWEFGVIS
jgi:hypothetical protein